MSITSLIRPDLLSFKAYSSARDEAKGGKVWLNANELPWEQEASDLRLNRYPDKQPQVLRDPLSQLYQVDQSQLAFFRGSDEAIDLLTRLFCRAGHDAIMICPPTFGMYAVCAQLQGAVTISVDLRADFQLDLSAIDQAWNKSVKIIFLCSPNNPTGNVIEERDLLALCQRYAGKSLIVVDEAYIEFADANSMARYIDQYANLAILRTFSKAYGLAGARFGVLLAQSELIDWMNAIMAPYPLPSLTIHTVLKALSPDALANTQARIACIKSERQRLSLALQQLPMVIHVYDSEANYILVRVKEGPSTMQYCAKRGLILRCMNNRAGLENCIRISIGTASENDAVLQILQSLG